jgi:hypothetical protein
LPSTTFSCGPLENPDQVIYGKMDFSDMQFTVYEFFCFKLKQKIGLTYICHAKQWPTPPSGIYGIYKESTRTMWSPHGYLGECNIHVGLLVVLIPTL